MVRFRDETYEDTDDDIISDDELLQDVIELQVKYVEILEKYTLLVEKHVDAMNLIEQLRSLIDDMKAGDDNG